MADRTALCRAGKVRRLTLAACAVSLLAIVALPAGAQQGSTQPSGRRGAAGGRQAGVPRPIPRGVFGGVPMTATDSAIQQITTRLDFDSYKALIKGLAQFGDREQGTERNAKAVDWIEAQLRSWGYTTERIKYDYVPRGGGAAEPREEVYDTKVGSTVPGEMYIISGHMDGRGGGGADWICFFDSLAAAAARALQTQRESDGNVPHIPSADVLMDFDPESAECAV